MVVFGEKMSNDMKQTFGRRLHGIRTGLGLSMREVAQLGMSVAHLSKLEHDESNPTLPMLEKLALVFKMTVGELTSGTEGVTELEMPETLREFINQYSSTFPELSNENWQRSLTSVRLRGRYPTSGEEWLSIFMGMRQAFKNVKTED
jgi:transcriptional regulator with XRE-family HTH domain